jgi:CelD/BcsL family acetyltransferase involved in cellulose biosynthesis
MTSAFGFETEPLAARLHPPRVDAAQAMAQAYVAKVWTCAEDLLPHKAAWQALEATATAPALFQSFDWSLSIVRSTTRPDHPAPQPRIVGVFTGDRLVAVMPLSVARFGPLRIVRWLGEPLAQYGDALIAPGHNAALGAVWREIRTWRGVDSVALRRVRADATIAPALAATRGGLAMKNVSAWSVSLTGHASIEAVGRAVDAKAWRDRQRLRRRLMELGDVTFDILPAGQAAQDAVRVACGWKRDWLAALGRHSLTFATPVWVDAMAALAAMDGSVKPLVVVVRLDGAPICVEYGFLYKQRFHAFLGAAQAGHERASPTKAAMEETIGWCLENKVAVYDLLAGDDPYKVDWAPDRVAVMDWIVPLRWRGHLYAGVILKVVRPMVRDLYTAMPVGLKRLAARVTGRL